MQSVVFAESFRGDFLDPMNNDLFEVVTETEYYRDYDMEFDNYEIIYKDDYSAAKAVHTIVGYDGKVTETVLCDYTDSETAYAALDAALPKKEVSESENTYNDGLTRKSSPETGFSTLCDITDYVRYAYIGQSYYGYDYNMGLLIENENDGWTGKGEDEPREHKTTITEVMTTNKMYEFNCYITTFNDDGYALMRYNDKTYIVKLKKGIIPTVTYNGEKIAFDQIPVIENGRTLVPLRAIFEKIGAEVAWEESTQTVTASKDDIKVSLTIDNTKAYVNGEEVTIDVPAKVVNGRTLVPARFVADCFGVDVQWDESLQRVSLTEGK